MKIKGDLQDVSQLCTKQVGTGEMIKSQRKLKKGGIKRENT